MLDGELVVVRGSVQTDERFARCHVRRVELQGREHLAARQLRRALQRVHVAEQIVAVGARFLLEQLPQHNACRFVLSPLYREARLRHATLDAGGVALENGVEHGLCLARQRPLAVRVLEQIFGAAQPDGRRVGVQEQCLLHRRKRRLSIAQLTLERRELE